MAKIAEILHSSVHRYDTVLIRWTCFTEMIRAVWSNIQAQVEQEAT